MGDAMRIRALVACVVSVAGLTATASPAQSAPVRLAGRTTITAPRGAGQLLVQVPRTVMLPGSCATAPEVSVSGTAAFAAVVLVPTPYRAGQSAVVFGRLPGGRVFDTICAVGQRPLPAGTYTLTVVHTPGTATVTLTLPGLAGRVSLTRLRAARASAAVLPRFHAPTDVSASAGGWGAEGRLAGTGMTATVTWLAGRLDAAVYGDCAYPPDAPTSAPAEVRYAPGCPVGQAALSWAVGSTAVLFAASTLGVPAGTYGIGAWYAAPVGAVTSGGTVGLWVPFA